MIKTILTISSCIILIASACKTKKQPVDTNKKNELKVNPSFEPEVVSDNGVMSEWKTGTVTGEMKHLGCDLLIKVDSDNDVEHADSSYSLFTATFLYPVSLKDEFKKDGLRIKFKYRPSRAYPGACTVGMPAIFEEVILLE
jgi:hypothetical protein